MRCFTSISFFPIFLFFIFYFFMDFAEKEGLLEVYHSRLITDKQILSSVTVGVAYDIHEKKLSTEVKREGLHSGSPGYRFIIFPSVFQSISFEELECVNKDGIEIELNVQFQYRARPKELRDLILQFKDKDRYLKLLK